MKEPKIRFKEFSGEWKIDKIGNFSTSFSGGTPNAGVSAYYGGNIPFIRSGEIHEDKTELSLTEEGYNNSSAKIVEKGTLLYALYGATSGDVGISKIRGAINQAILAITPYRSIETDFLADFLLCNKYKIVGELLQGGQGNLSGSLVKDINVAYPCISEQQSIASYFQHLDALIQSTTKKIESLKQVKAASMQSMFPQEGETTPRVRFKGFEGEWEEKRLGDIAERYDNLRIPIKESFRVKGLTPYYGANGIQDYVDGYTHDGEYVLVAEDGANDLNNYPVIYVVGKIWVNNHAHVLQAIKNYSTAFLKFRLQCSNIKSVIVGGSRAKLNAAQLMNIYILFPSFVEQCAIASFFTILDRQITLQTQRLEKLKQIKSACLDNMFV